MVSGGRLPKRKERKNIIIYSTPSGTTYPLFRDILQQPHLLIAGTTGSGKSTVLNGLIGEMLLHPPTEDEGGTALILIDLKLVELGRYKRLPHVLRCATEPEEAAPALEFALSITRERYHDMERRGLTLFDGGDIYVVIDELADLMTTQRRQVTPLIQRLTQIGRAAKVHVIACTQCPLRTIIPTEIGCNFTARLGLRTRNRQDSRNIIGPVDGFPGLQTLPDHGQGYYQSPGNNRLWKLPFVQEAEIRRLIDFWQEQVSKPCQADKTQSKGFLAACKRFLRKLAS